MRINLKVSPSRYFGKGRKGGAQPPKISNWFCKFHKQTFLVSTSDMGWAQCPKCEPFKLLKTPQLARLGRLKELNK